MKNLVSATLAAVFIFATAQPASAIKQFLVFFHDADPHRLDAKQWQITAEADAVINEFAALYRRDFDNARVLLTAGDQWVGTLEASIERSQRRANAVRDALVEKGVPRAVIFTKPCGFTLRMVQTQPQTKEPQNRFVSMDIRSPDAALIEGSREGCETPQ